MRGYQGLVSYAREESGVGYANVPKRGFGFWTPETLNANQQDTEEDETVALRTQ
jgi:hypothetical protein